MIRHQQLTLLFAALLGELTLTGCPIFGGCPDTNEETVDVDPAALADAIGDGFLSMEECYAFCHPDMGGSTGTSTSTSTSTTGESTGATTGGTDATTDATTGTSTSTSTSTSTTTTTTNSSVGDATAGDDGFINCEMIAGVDDKVTCIYDAYCIGGRRPAGLASQGRGRGDTPLARWFAEVAHLEAASVPAFERLAVELARHGAPQELIDAAVLAARDEVRHADAVAALAAREGGRPAAPAIAPPAPAGLVDLAIDNAVEGCVGETWAALIAAHQAARAADPEVRACMAAIADDEARHAALAWAIDAWLAPRLSDDERARVIDARRRAALALRAAPDLDPHLSHEAGLPSPADAARLWSGLDRDLWSAAA